MIVNFPFPHEVPFGSGSIWIMNITLRDADGFNLIGVFLLMVIMCRYLFTSYFIGEISCSIGVTRTFPILYFASFLVINVYQNTLASGIYAIDYDLDTSECKFEQLDDNRMEVICNLPLENLSDDEVEFDVRFFNESLLEV